MLMLARFAALCFGIAVLVLFVLPAIMRTPAPQDTSARQEKASDAPPPGVKIAENTTFGEPAAQGGSQGEPTQPTSSLQQGVVVQPRQAPNAAPDSPEHVAAIEQDEADDSTPRKRKRFYRVIVQDAGTLKTGNHLIHLQGIEVRGQDDKCEDSTGKLWPCGSRARTALTQLIRGRAIVCDVPPSGDSPEFGARCKIGQTDLSYWMVEQGWAKPTSESNDKLTKARDDAKQARLGLWGGASQFDVEPVDEPMPAFGDSFGETYDQQGYQYDRPTFGTSEPEYDQ